MPSSLTNLLYHIVFPTKDRRESLTPPLRDALRPYVGGKVRGDAGAPPEACR